MLRATLYFASVKKANEATDVYLDAIDEVFGEEEEDIVRASEMVRVTRAHKKEKV